MITQSPYNFTFTASSLRPEPVGIVAEIFSRAGSWDGPKRTMLAANALFRREFIRKLDAGLKHLGQVEAASTNAREETAVPKQADKLRKSLKECQEWEREVVLPLAQQRLGLDDGVKPEALRLPREDPGNGKEGGGITQMAHKKKRATSKRIIESSSFVDDHSLAKFALGRSALIRALRRRCELTAAQPQIFTLKRHGGHQRPTTAKPH